MEHTEKLITYKFVLGKNLAFRGRRLRAVAYAPNTREEWQLGIATDELAVWSESFKTLMASVELTVPGDYDSHVTIMLKGPPVNPDLPDEAKAARLPKLYCVELA